MASLMAGAAPPAACRGSHENHCAGRRPMMRCKVSVTYRGWCSHETH